MFPKQSLEKKIGVQIATSGAMDNAISLWLAMYENKPPWMGGEAEVRSLNLPAAIAEEMARLVLTEFQFEVTGSQRATFINGQLENYIENMNNIVEMWAALGGIVVKPYASGDDGNGNPDRIYLDFVQANRFYPTAFNSNKEITAAVFVDTKRVGDYMFTRLEHHNLEGTHYTVTNRAFKSERLNTMTTEDDQLSVEHPFMQEVPLDSVDEWCGLEPVVELDDIEKPLFAYIKIPRANTMDPHSPLGASVYSRATDIIQDADEQYSRILWEFRGTELAIDAAEDLFDMDKTGHPIIPNGRQRLFRTYDFEGKTNGGFFENFSPDIRDTPLFNGLNKMFRKIEFLCGLSYGTISDLTDVDRTATEVKASKQRSYTTVNGMQKSLDTGFDDILYIMDVLCSLYNMAPEGIIDKECTWGDGVLEDTEVEYQRRWAMVLSGKMKVEKFYAWYFGCTEEEAKEYIPEQPTYPPPE